MLMELSTAKVKVNEKQPLRGNKSVVIKIGAVLRNNARQTLMKEPCAIDTCHSILS